MPMLQRLESIQPQDFEKCMVPFVNDVTVGWDISEISSTEVSEFLSIVIRKLERQDITIPEQIWDSWIYVLGFDKHDNGRFKSLKDFGKWESVNRIPLIQKLLVESKDVIFSFRQRKQIDSLFCFLLDSATSSLDVWILFDEFSKLPTRLHGPLTWFKMVGKLLVYKDTSLDVILDLFFKMMCHDQITPSAELVSLLRTFVLCSDTQGLSPSARDVLHRLHNKNEFYNIMIGCIY
jgi:hypothetical protein